MSSLSQYPHLPILLVMGLSIVLGTTGARWFQRLRLPQVVGYIVIGLLLGATGLRVLDAAAVERLRPFNFFALGVIGFMVGGELHRDVFRKYGRQCLTILISEGMAAFFAVGLLCGGVLWALTGQGRLAVAVGMLFGSIASATAPAATVDVLWEYKARGPLTSMVFAIVALDDALALLLFALSASMAGRLLGAAGAPLGLGLLRVAADTAGSAAVGAVSGIGLNVLLRRMHEPDRMLALVLGVLALAVGLAVWAEWDPILAAMALGATVANLAPRRSHPAFDLVKSFSTPIYVLFFVMVGARLDLRGLAPWLWGLAVLYVIGRTTGKWVGSWAGARWTGAPSVVQRYLGACLFSQAGVAIGLSILAADTLADLPPVRSVPLPALILTVITATTFLVQIVGPPSVKWAIIRAGEAGLGVTEEDLLRSWKAGDVAEPAVIFREEQTLAEVLNGIAASDHSAFLVVNAAGQLTGVITMDDFRKGFQAQPLARWLLACDLMQPPPDPASTDQRLNEALTLMNSQGLDYLPVVDDLRSRRPAGLLERRSVRLQLSTELLRRQQLAEVTKNGSSPGDGT